MENSKYFFKMTLRLSKSWQNFILWMNCPFKLVILHDYFSCVYSYADVFTDVVK